MINDFATWVEAYFNHKLTIAEARVAEYLLGNKKFVVSAGRPAMNKEQILEWVRGYKASSFYGDEFMGMGVLELYLYVPNRDNVYKEPVDEKLCRHRVRDDLVVHQCQRPATERVRGFKFCYQHAALLRKRFDVEKSG